MTELPDPVMPGQMELDLELPDPYERERVVICGVCGGVCLVYADDPEADCD